MAMTQILYNPINKQSMQLGTFFNNIATPQLGKKK